MLVYLMFKYGTLGNIMCIDRVENINLVFGESTNSTLDKFFVNFFLTKMTWTPKRLHFG